jgi:hypothetical protein
MALQKIVGSNISPTTAALIRSLQFNSSSSYIGLPVGTTAQRPTGISYGTIRFNTTRDQAEIYNTQTGIPDWNTIGSETGIDGGDAFIRTNGTTITKNITLGPTANSDQKYTHGFLLGDITIDSGITVTVETGSQLIIIDEQPNFTIIPDIIIQSGLTTWLDAGDRLSYSGSGTIWRDLTSGNQYTINGDPTFLPNTGGVFLLDGVNDNVTLQSSSIPTGSEITFGVWIYGTTNKTSSIIEARTAGGNRTLNIHLTWVDGVVYFDTGNDSGSNRLSKQSTSLEYLGWHYWVFVKNATTGVLEIYLDGALWASSTGNTIPIGTTASVRVGSYADGTTYHAGYLSELHIYGRALSSTEILYNYTVDRNKFAGSVF